MLAIQAVNEKNVNLANEVNILKANNDNLGAELEKMKSNIDALMKSFAIQKK